MTILMTGFEPFGGDNVNPSWEAVKLLPESIGGAKVHKLLLPVEFARSGDRLIQAARELHPDVIVCCGVAGGRKEVTPELVAVNWRMGAIPDNAGVQYAGERINPCGPDAIMTDLPVLFMVEAVKKAGLPARLSLSAGAYVCNDLYYALMQRQQELGCKGLFIHVPAMTELPAQDTAQALEICLASIAAVQ